MGEQRRGRRRVKRGGADDGDLDSRRRRRQAIARFNDDGVFGADLRRFKGGGEREDAGSDVKAVSGGDIVGGDAKQRIAVVFGDAAAGGQGVDWLGESDIGAHGGGGQEQFADDGD